MCQGVVRWCGSRNRCAATSPQRREWAARQVVNVGTFSYFPPSLTYPTTGHIWKPPSESEVCGYTGEALAVFCSTSTATKVTANIRPLASAFYPEP
jgi:hypothetical protein